MKICLTGHRPSKMYGYDLSDERWQNLKENLKAILRSYDCTEAISGMALGCDMIFALAVLELKEEGMPIDLRCAVPVKSQESKWNASDIRRYKQILEAADFVDILSEGPYKPYLMQERNKYMVDNSDVVIAVWNGGKGGTSNCVDYAVKQNKKIIYINPKEFKKENERNDER